jgi:S-phase kinase-associated protein 1
MAISSFSLQLLLFSFYLSCILSPTKMAQEASSSTSSKKILLRIADSDTFEIEAPIAKQMKTVQAYLEEDVEVSTIPLSNVFSKDLAKIIEYCKKEITGEVTKDFEAGFVKEMGDEEVKDLFLASNYLNVDRLFEFLSQTIANRIENKSIEYVRMYFGIDNDFTPDEEAKLREERAWAFRGVNED